MTASSAETAELPVTGPTVVATAPGVGPVIEQPVAEPCIEPRFGPPVRADAGDPAPVTAAPAGPTAKPACRAELRARRLQARRVRRRYACLGLSLLAGTLGATVIVLDTLH